MRPENSSDERRAVIREDDSASRRRTHMRPENSVEERQFISLAVAASIHDAKEQGRDGLVNFDPSCPPPGVSAAVPRIPLPSPFSPPSLASNSHFGAGPSNMLRYNSSFSGTDTCLLLMFIHDGDGTVMIELPSKQYVVLCKLCSTFVACAVRSCRLSATLSIDLPDTLCSTCRPGRILQPCRAAARSS